MAGIKQAGIPDMQRKLRAFGRKYPDEVGRGLYLETEIEATEVKKRTPVWNPDNAVPKGHTPGSLRASVHVIGPVRVGDKVYTLIVAGGTAAPYALYVHEDLEAFHKTGQAKYIESVILESRPFILQRVAARVELNRAAE
jgi:hypothetical protein